MECKKQQKFCFFSKILKRRCPFFSCYRCRNKQESNCVFCKIINKEIPSHIIYQDVHVLAFLDTNPIEAGHVLLITKKCHKNILTIQKKEFISIGKAVKKITQLLKDRLNVDNFNFANNYGKIAGQIISHFHIHIVPKYKRNYGLKWKINPKFSQENNEKIWKKLI